jgi:hypothetical protein
MHYATSNLLIASEVDVPPCWGDSTSWCLGCHNATAAAPGYGICRFKYSPSVVLSLAQTDNNYFKLGIGSKEGLSAPLKLRALYGSFQLVEIHHCSRICRFRLICA